MILRKLSKEQQKVAIWWIFASAQLAMAVGGILSHFWGEQVPFLVGVLEGYSVVGNLFFLSQVRNLIPRNR
jgi:hypothetical protein